MTRNAHQQSLDLLVQMQAPRLGGRIRSFRRGGDFLFTVRGRGARIALIWGKQAWRPATNPLDAARRAARAAEQVAYGLTTAAALRLDADGRWVEEQKLIHHCD